MLKARLFLLTVGLLAGLFLSEAALRLFAPQVRRLPRVWRYDSDLGWEHIPLARGRMIAPEYDVDIAINAAGQRDRDYETQRQPDSWRLLAIGDSYVEGWGVPLEATVAKRLEDMLQQRRPDITVEVINMGVSGYGTDQELLYFEREGRLYQPDDVLVFFYANDLWNNVSQVGIGAEEGFKPYFVLTPGGGLRLAGVPVPKVPSWDEAWRATRPWPQRLRRYLHRHCHLYVLVQQAFFPPLGPLEKRQRYYQALYETDISGRWQEHWELTGRLLREFDLQVQRAGARMHVVYIPAMAQVYAGEWERRLRLNRLEEIDLDRAKPSRQLAAFAGRHDLSFLDLYPVFLDHPETEPLYYTQDTHWTEAGHELAAQTVAAFLMAAHSDATP